MILTFLLYCTKIMKLCAYMIRNMIRNVSTGRWKMPSLTQSLAEKTPHVPAGQAFVRDSELPGFALRVTKASKSFVFERRIHGRMRRVTIGRFGPLTADQAREEASRMAADISQGI